MQSLDQRFLRVKNIYLLVWLNVSTFSYCQAPNEWFGCLQNYFQRFAVLDAIASIVMFQNTVDSSPLAFLRPYNFITSIQLLNQHYYFHVLAYSSFFNSSNQWEKQLLQHWLFQGSLILRALCSILLCSSREIRNLFDTEHCYTARVLCLDRHLTSGVMLANVYSNLKATSLLLSFYIKACATPSRHIPSDSNRNVPFSRVITTIMQFHCINYP